MGSAATSSLLLLTINSIMGIHKSWGDAVATIFIIASYTSLLVLFCYLRWLEGALPGSAAKDRAKFGIWLTMTLLTAMFSWRVAALMPGLMAAGVWLMAVSMVIGGFYGLFPQFFPADKRL